MSRVKCATIGCKHHVREGTRRRGHAADGSELADGRSCWRCRRRQRPAAGRRGIEPRSPDLESRAVTRTRPAPTVNEATMRRLRRSPALRRMLALAAELLPWGRIVEFETARDFQRGAALTGMRLGHVMLEGDPITPRSFLGFEINARGLAAMEALDP